MHFSSTEARLPTQHCCCVFCAGCLTCVTQMSAGVSNFIPRRYQLEWLFHGLWKFKAFEKIIPANWRIYVTANVLSMLNTRATQKQISFPSFIFKTKAKQNKQIPYTLKTFVNIIIMILISQLKSQQKQV